jgi:predicted MFS family arabinose efflux permease
MRLTRELTPLRVLVAAHSVSAFGSYLDFVVLNLFAYRVTGSPLQTGLFMALRLGTSFAVGMAAGPIVQPHRRRRLMVGGDLAQATGLLVLVLAPGPAVGHGLLYALAIVAGASSTLSGVSLRSSVPDLVGQERRVRANGLLVTGRSLGMTLGFATAGLIVAGAGYRAAFEVDAATYAFSAAAISTLPFPRRVAGAEPGTSGLGAILRAHRESSVLWRLAPLTMLMIPLRGIDAFGSASHQVGIPVYASLVDPGNPADFMGHFWAAWAIGNILAYQALSRLRRGGVPASEAAFAIGTVLMSSFFILAFTGVSGILLLAVALGAGLSDGFTEVTYVSRLQALPDERRGYVFGLSAMAENSGLGLGMVICALLLVRLPPLPVVGLLHGTAIGLALVFLAFMLVRGRRAARTVVEVGR